MTPQARQRLIAVTLPALITLTLYGAFVGRSRQLDQLKRRDQELQQAVARAEITSRLEVARAKLRGLERRSGERAASAGNATQPAARLNAAQMENLVGHLAVARLRLLKQSPLSQPPGAWVFELEGDYGGLVAALDGFAAGTVPGAPLEVTLEGVRPGTSQRTIRLEVTP
jgi:hypothetical protein